MRYIDSIYKKSRRLGFSLLESNKEFTKGKKRTTPPGQHGAKRVKLSNYGLQLQEKQKLMYLYGLNDRQFRRFFILAKKRQGATTLNLLQILESRLDSVLYRAALAPTRRSSRQLITHGHVLVNGKKVNIPSLILNVGDVISISDKSKQLKIINEVNRSAADFIKLDNDSKKAEFLRLPERHELPENINESYVVEWFNRLL